MRKLLMPVRGIIGVARRARAGTDWRLALSLIGGSSLFTGIALYDLRPALIIVGTGILALGISNRVWRWLA